jgi:hypothetical protein
LGSVMGVGPALDRSVLGRHAHHRSAAGWPDLRGHEVRQGRMLEMTAVIRASGDGRRLYEERSTRWQKT